MSKAITNQYAQHVKNTVYIDESYRRQNYMTLLRMQCKELTEECLLEYWLAYHTLDIVMALTFGSRGGSPIMYPYVDSSPVSKYLKEQAVL